jgi:ribosomal protein S27E
MITFECTWCENELTIEALDATRVECAECSVVVEFAPDEPSPIAVAA